MDTVDLGGVRLHVVTAWPGIPGEGDRVAREVARADPALLLLDLDTPSALALREAAAQTRAAFEPAFVDALFADEVARRHAKGEASEHPFVALARVARNKRINVQPLRPGGAAPGFFKRRRARKAAQRAPDVALEAFPAAFAKSLADADAWDPHADAAAIEARVSKAMTEGHQSVLAVLQAHRAEAVLKGLRALRRIPT